MKESRGYNLTGYHGKGGRMTEEITAIKQITKDQAIQIYDSGIWKDWTDEEIVKFQLFQDCLAIPFSRFHEATEKVLDRSVWTHEFADQQRLIDEYLGKRPKPTFREIVELIPEEKRLIIAI